MNAQTLPATPERPPPSGRTVVAVSGCGLTSMALLAAAVLFAHHWGALTGLIVAGWAAATLASAGGVWLLASHRTAGTRGGIAVRIAGTAVLATIVALLFAGVVWATGGDPAGCGGG